MTKIVIETTNGWYMENEKEKVELDDIVGLIKTDEPTDSVQLKKKAQLNICERKLLDMEEDRDYYKTKSASLEEGYIKLQKENEQLKQELKRCKDWINSDKNDYELTLAFIKNKGYSLKDVLEYEKELSK